MIGGENFPAVALSSVPSGPQGFNSLSVVENTHARFQVTTLWSRSEHKPLNWKLGDETILIALDCLKKLEATYIDLWSFPMYRWRVYYKLLCGLETFFSSERVNAYFPCTNIRTIPCQSLKADYGSITDDSCYWRHHQSSKTLSRWTLSKPHVQASAQ